MVSGHPLKMIIDTGATWSTLTTTQADNLISVGLATEGPPATTTLADGSQHKTRTVYVDSMFVGTHKLSNVKFGVTTGEPLLGLSVLTAIGKFSIDAVNNKLQFN
jgi:clan AA aspartic protease (TIGR02281 family)